MNKESISTNNLSFNIQAFINDRKAQNLSSGTIYFYEKKLRVLCNYCKANDVQKIEEITPELIRNYLLFLEAKGHNEGGIHGFYRSLKTFLLWYQDEYDLDNWKNPIKKVKAPKVSIEPLEGISKENFSRLFNECEDSYYGKRDKTILLVLIETGMRASELCSLNIEDINFIDSSILIRKGKGRKPRYVFFGKTARKQLRAWIRIRGVNSGDLFLTKSKERMNYMALRELVRRLSVKAGIPEPGLHSFRRAFALESLRKGVDVHSLSKLMGHSDLQVLSRYLKQTTQDLGNAYKSVMDD